MSYIVKDSNGKYYRFNPNAIHWTERQSEAERFKNREDAEKLSKHMNAQSSESRVVKLKTCKEETLPHPKVDTVFIDSSRVNSPKTPVIVQLVCGEDEKDPDIYTVDSMYGESIHCTLSEYWERVKSGKIQIIWEPES